MYIEIEATDYQPMEDFNLRWRWTDATWNLLPQSDLLQIRPLNPVKADELQRYSISLLSPGKLNPELFHEVSYLYINNDETFEIVKAWLQQHPVAPSTEIIVSWDNNTAVVTNWSTFCSYWDDFCYPVSDDVVVWPKDQSWALLYFHDEIFSFGFKALGLP